MDSGQPIVAANITELLSAWRGGDQEALKRIVTSVHAELHSIARRMLRNKPTLRSLQATAIVNEAYLRLADCEGVDWQSRAQFFGIASSIIRHILVDHARTRLAEKRGGSAIRVSLTNSTDAAEERDLDLIALDDALLSLRSADPRQSRMVELRFLRRSFREGNGERRDCCGCLCEVITDQTMEFVCNECGVVLSKEQVAPIILAMASTEANCTHCGRVNQISGFTRSSRSHAGTAVVGLMSILTRQTARDQAVSHRAWNFQLENYHSETRAAKLQPSRGTQIRALAASAFASTVRFRFSTHRLS